MQSIVKWTALSAAAVTVALTNFEAAHPIEHAAWFLGGALWSLCCVVVVVVVRRSPDRNKMTNHERQQYDDDMSI